MGKLLFMTKTSKTTSNSYEKPTITKIEKSRVEIVGSIPADKFETYRTKALKNINEEVKIDGFRKGKVPESTLVSKVGEMTILEEMAQLALSEAYPQIVIGEKIDAIGHPEINITKIAKGNPLEYKIVTAIVPETKLPDYKKLAKEEFSKKAESVEVTEKDIDDAILNIRRSRADHSGHDHAKMSPEEHTKAVDASLPELNDEFVTSLGKFENVADFKSKVKTLLEEEKVSKNKDKKRIAFSDKLIEASEIDLPEVLVQSELKRIEAQFTEDITRMGVTLEDYAKHAKKTIDDLRNDWRPLSEKKAKLQLILNKIAEIEKVVVDPKDIEAEVEHIVEHYKDADRERAAVYAETVLMNEKVYQMLEEGK